MLETVVARAPGVDFENAHLREDGRLIRDMFVAQVKTPEESKGPWDLYKILGTLPGDEAFRPLSQSECPAVRKG